MFRRFAIYGLVMALVLMLGAGSVYAAPPDPGRHPVPGQGGASGVVWAPEACTDILMDGSFEDGSPNSYWNEASTNFGTPLCENGFCGSAGQAARTGTWWAWFGGIASYEVGSLDQDVTFPATGYAMLNFWLWSETDTVEADYLAVQIDSTPVYTITGIETVNYPTWTQILVPLNAYANGAAHNVKFYSETGTAGDVTNFHVDDAAICSNAPTNVSLVSLDTAAAPAPILPLAVAGIVALGAVLGARRLIRRTR